MRPVQKEVPLSHKLQDHACELQKLPESIESYKFVSNRARMSKQLDSRKDSHPPKFQCRPRLLVKQSFILREEDKISVPGIFKNLANGGWFLSVLLQP